MFFREIVARTTRARAALPGDHARTLRVLVGRRGEAFAGRLWIEEAATSSRAREVKGKTCGEVIGALGLIAALAVDPSASVASRPEPQAAPPSASAPDAGPREQTATGPAAHRELAQDAQPAGRRTPIQLGAGAQGEVAMIADAVFAGRLFADLEVGDSARTWTPSFRVALGRSLDTQRRASSGGATLRFTQASVDVCPLRAAIVASIAVRPCVGASGGVLEAQGTDVNGAPPHSRPWTSALAHARLTWSPFAALAVEVEAGAVVPLHRDSFFVRVVEGSSAGMASSEVDVYRAPPVAFVTRAGIGVRFR
jgi:hypothetical protein